MGFCQCDPENTTSDENGTEKVKQSVLSVTTTCNFLLNKQQENSTALSVLSWLEFRQGMLHRANCRLRSAVFMWR